MYDMFNGVCRSIKMWDLRRTHCTKKSGPVPKYSFDYAGTSIRAHGGSIIVAGKMSVFPKVYK